MNDFQNWRGKDVFDGEGNKIGTVGELYVDDDTEQPAWMTVKTGLFGTKESFVPIAMARVQDEAIQVAASAGKIKDAPRIDVDEQLSPEEEQQLYAYYEQGSDDDEDHPAKSDGRASDAADAAGVSTGADRDEDRKDMHTDEELTAAEARAAQKGATAVATSQEAVDAKTAEAEKDVVGRYRLRRYKVREEKTITVPVEREEVRLEPVDEHDTSKDDKAA